MTKEVNQFSLFDLEEKEHKEKTIPYELDERVQIIIPESKLDDTESFFYLKGLEKKRGLIIKVVKQPKLQYQVEVGNKIAYVYHDELIGGWPL